MSYSDKIKESKDKRHHHAVATKIRDMMGQLRMKRTTSERRWVWELMQNAKDVSWEDIGISIEIKLHPNGSAQILEFAHNGKPFSLDNITYLIEQNSSKDRKPNEGEIQKQTGKFGTGFLTTHLLSEKVEVEGIVKEPDLPYKKFNLLLDRSGREIEYIIESVNYSMTILEQLLEQSTSINFIQTKFNTKFHYQLDEKGQRVMEVGLQDLYHALPFVLAFNPLIKHVASHPISTFYAVGEPQRLTEKIRIIPVTIINNGNLKTREIAVIYGSTVTLAIELETIENQIHILPFDDRMPRLFCDFPLIGSEDFAFPVIINSTEFNPTEPRDGVPFNNDEEPEFIENRAILSEAVTLYFELLEYAAENNWQRMYNLISTELPPEKDWISREWYKDNIQKPMREHIVLVKLVDTVTFERASMELDSGGFIDFPYHARGEEQHRLNIREQLWELCNINYFFILPQRMDIHHWQNIIWAEKHHLSISSLIDILHECQNVEKLSELTGKDETDVIQWLNSFYKIACQDEHSLSQINQDKFAIIPNQKGDFKIKSALFRDANIEEDLKDVLALLESDVKDRLFHKSLIFNEELNPTASFISFASITQDSIIDEINNRLNKPNLKKVREAISLLTALFSHDNDFAAERELFYCFSKDLLGDEIPEKRIIEKWDNRIWEVSDKIRIGRLVKEVADCKNIDQLRVKLSKSNDDETILWLDEFVRYILHSGNEDKLNDKNSPILPDQNGNFKIKEALFEDEVMDEDLKNISSWLKHDCRADLLHPGIQLDFPENKKITVAQLAAKIVQLLSPKLTPDRSDEVKQIAKALLIWLSDNEDLAVVIFPDYFKNKHLLFDDEDMVEMTRKSRNYDKIQNLLTENDLDEEVLLRLLKSKNLRELLDKSEQSEEKLSKPVDIQGLLIRLGIANFEDYERARQDEATAGYFRHTSEPSPEMFEHVQSLISRTKDNVRKHLESLPDYDCANWRAQSLTVISGVRKKGREPLIVIRPSDGGKTIFYYPQEFDALSSDDYELWVDNGDHKPRRLTLGEILRRNRINRIDV